MDFFFSNGDLPTGIFSDFFSTALFSEMLLLHASLTTSTQQLLFQSIYFFRAAAFLRSSGFDRVISSQQWFFQNTYFLGTKLLPGSYFVRKGNSLGQLLFGTATFLMVQLPRIKISTEELLWSKQVLLYSISFFRRATFSKNLLFLESYFFRAATFSKDVTFYNSNLFRKATFSQHTFLRVNIS